MSEKPILSIVIPLYSEEDGLRETLLTIRKNIETLNLPYELILIDDGSLDNTWNIIASESQETTIIHAIRFSRNFGKENALCAGLEAARGNAIIVMDGDLQHPPELIPDMVKIWRETHADIVETVKMGHERTTPIRKIGAKLFYLLLRELSGYDLAGLSDYKLLDRKVVDAWLQLEEHETFFRGMVAWLGFKRVRLEFTVPKRLRGESKWSFYTLVKLSLNAIVSFSARPLYLFSLFGSLFFIFAFALLCRVLYQYLNGSAVSGFTTVIILELILGGMIMFGFGLLGIYIAKTFDEVKKRPRYIISERIGENTH